MIYAINGYVYAFRLPHVVVKCSSGLFYEIIVSQTAMKNMVVGEAVFLYVWIHHDQRSFEETMYGFENEEERSVFFDLISVSKIGPKTAMTIIGFPLDTVRQKIAAGDWLFFKAVRGIGTECAKRIILELQKPYLGEND
jgi:Holliday junction DNA helicase RuvA